MVFSLDLGGGYLKSTHSTLRFGMFPFLKIFVWGVITLHTSQTKMFHKIGVFNVQMCKGCACVDASARAWSVRATQSSTRVSRWPREMHRAAE